MNTHHRVLLTLAIAGISGLAGLGGLATVGFARDGAPDGSRDGPHSVARDGAPNVARDGARVDRSHGNRGRDPASHGSHPNSQAYPHPGGSFGPVGQHGPVGRPPMTERRFSSGQRVFETTHAVPGGGTFRAWRYGHAMTGFVEHPMKPGYMSRTYVQGGRVLYAHVYRQNTFQRFGHAYHYQRLVPAIAFGSAYYAWAARPWSAPVSYQWQWDSQPWHRAYGNDFTPYSNYSSLDQWLTDYMVAENFRNAYEAENAPPVANAAPSKRGNSAPPAPGPRPYWDTPDDGQRPDWEAPDNRRPYWEEQPTAEAAPPGNAAPAGKSVPTGEAAPAGTSVPAGKVAPTGTSTPVGKAAPAKPTNPNSSASPRPSTDDTPPPLSGQMKAELNAQIKRQLAERQAPATQEVEDLPDSLKPGHTLFRVNTPLDVPSKASGELCSLRANDYVERTGDMDQNGMVPVKVKVGAASDCSIGLVTKVSVNDLEAMESEQQRALTDALVAASNNMGKGRALPQAPATTPMYLAAGQTHPTPDATKTLGELQ